MRWALVLLLAACAAARVSLPVPERAPPPGTPLADPSSFTIAEPEARAQALFLEASKVMLHERCTNCHPAGDAPRQRRAELHEPPVDRAFACDTCHQDRNLEHARVPGAPDWQLAPRKMAWEGLTPAQLCAQLKDETRNGNRSLASIVEHASHDRLIAWGWAPGADREPAPGTQASYGALMDAWVKAGAACPR